MVVEKSRGVSDADKSDALSGGLLLALAYATTIGGMSTIIGTPPNVLARWIYGRNLRHSNRLFRLDAHWPALSSGFALSSQGWLVLTRGFSTDRRCTGESRSGRGYVRDISRWVSMSIQSGSKAGLLDSWSLSYGCPGSTRFLDSRRQMHRYCHGGSMRGV